MNFKGFKKREFPVRRSVVYILFVVHGNGQEIPIYVGQTNSMDERIGDYLRSQRSLNPQGDAVFGRFNPTNFKVGFAVWYFQEKGCRVFLRYRATEDPKREERQWLATFYRYPLLNDLLLDELKDLNDDKMNRTPLRQGEVLSREKARIIEYLERIIKGCG